MEQADVAIESERPNRWRRWLVAARPWALPASVMPVLFGTALAVVVRGAPFQPLRFAVALLAMILLHTAANMLSDVFDYRRGVDTQPTPVSGAIVRGWLSVAEVARAAGLLFVAGGALGAVLAWRVGPPLWWIGGVGVAIGLGYSALKAAALGDLAVFLNFGILGAAGAWTVQTGRFSFYPVLCAIPMSLLVVAILHANNWRDIAGDGRVNVRTLASVLGDTGSLHYYGLLIFAPYGFLAALIWAPRGLMLDTNLRLPLTAAAALLSLPKAVALWARAVRRHHPRQPLDFIALDGATAQLNLIFGLLLTAGVVAARYLEAAR